MNNLTKTAVKVFSLIFFCWLGVLVISFSQEGVLDQGVARSAYISALEEGQSEEELEILFAAFLETLPQYSDQGVTYYIVEGDIPLLEEEVEQYLNGLVEVPLSGERNPELIVNLVDGERDFWSEGNRHLTYAIDRASFNSVEEYFDVMQRMHEATSNWEEACPECGVDFQHLVEFDVSPSHDKVLFIVRMVSLSGTIIAKAFFPSYANHRYYLDVGSAFFTTNFDQTGILEHELGHVLGYRHEHIQDIPGCRSELGNWEPLTEYDPQSVMHYFCGGGGSLDLEITETDIEGHKELYAPQADE